MIKKIERNLKSKISSPYNSLKYLGNIFFILGAQDPLKLEAHFIAMMLATTRTGEFRSKELIPALRNWAREKGR